MRPPSPAAVPADANARWPGPKPPGRYLWILGLILLAAAGLRLYHLESQSLWLDELYSLASSAARYPDISPLREDQIIQPSPRFTSLSTARSWWSIWTGMRQGTHPPLYIAVLRPWREVFGQSDAAARWLSVVTALIAIGLIFDAGRTLYGIPAGLWSAALMAVAWPQLQYAREARPYALLLMLGLGALAALARIERSGANILRLIALAGCMLAMALTHYFCFGALLALGVYALLRLRGSDRWRTLLAMALAAMLFLLAWGPSLWAQRHTTQFPFLMEETPDHGLLTWRRIDELPHRFFIERFVEPLPMFGSAILLGLIAVTWIRRDLLLPLLWLFLTAGAVAALDLLRSTSHLLWIRYTLLASPGLYLMAAALGARRRRFLPHLLPGALLLLLLCVLSLPEFYRSQKEDWRGLGAFVHQRALPDEPIVFAASQAWYATDLCIGFSHYEHSPQRAVVVLSGPASPAVLDYLRSRPRLWIISDDVEPQRFLPGCVVERDERCGMLADRSAYDPGTPAWCVRQLRWPAAP
jgi:uncharacterized membrane protein